MPEQYGKDELISYFERRSVAELCFYEIYTIEKYLRLQRNDIKNINGLLGYADILFVSDINLLEQVRDSQFFSQINVFHWEEMDTQEQRRKLAENLYEVLELTKSYKRKK